MHSKNRRLRHANQKNNHFGIIDLKKDNTYDLKYLPHTMPYNGLTRRILIEIYSFILTKSNTAFRKEVLKPPGY